MFRITIVGFFLLFSLNASACDDKSCEKAYLAETLEHIANHVRRADTYRTERVAHALNRERHDYALYVHRHLIRIAQKFTEDPLKYKNLLSLGSDEYKNEFAG